MPMAMVATPMDVKKRGLVQKPHKKVVLKPLKLGKPLNLAHLPPKPVTKAAVKQVLAQPLKPTANAQAQNKQVKTKAELEQIKQRASQYENDLNKARD